MTAPFLDLIDCCDEEIDAKLGIERRPTPVPLVVLGALATFAIVAIWLIMTDPLGIVWGPGVTQ